MVLINVVLFGYRLVTLLRTLVSSP